MKQTPMPHEAERRAFVAQALRAIMTREYWRASQVLRSLAIDRSCDRETAQRFLTNLALCSEYDRLRCAAAGNLVSLGLTPFQASGASI